MTLAATKTLASTATILLLVPPPLFWAGNFIVGRAMHDAVPPLALSFWRWAIAFAVLLPFALPAMRRDLALYWQNRWMLAGAAFTGVFAFNTLIYLGLQTTTASNAVLLNSFIPILVVLLGAVFFGQGIGRVQVVGLLVSLFGVLHIALHGEWARLASLSFARGDVIVFCAMVSWAFYTHCLRRIPGEIDRIGLMGAQMVLAFIILVPSYLWELGTGASIAWSAETVSALAYLGVFPSVIAYVLYNLSVARLGASVAGQSIHLIPVFGVLLAVVFLGEQMHAYHALGIAAIACGLGCAFKP